MAMTGPGMGSAMIAAVQAIPGINITDTAEMQAYHNALGSAIVAYITGNAEIEPGTFQITGVQAGAVTKSVSGEGTII